MDCELHLPSRLCHVRLKITIYISIVHFFFGKCIFFTYCDADIIIIRGIGDGFQKPNEPTLSPHKQLFCLIYAINHGVSLFRIKISYTKHFIIFTLLSFILRIRIHLCEQMSIYQIVRMGMYCHHNYA